jgi:hypothetical protein
MNRKTIGLLAVSVFLASTLAACDSLSRIPAGQLAYPGSRLTKSTESYGDSNQATREYSFVTPRPTAAQVLAWYTSGLASYGYAASEPPWGLQATSTKSSQEPGTVSV